MVDSVLLELQRATHVTLTALGNELAGLELAPAEANVLANLADGGARTISQLAAQVGSRPTTMTTVLDRLQRRGLLERVAHPTDRRALLVELTAQGRRTARAVRRAYDRVESRALAGLTTAAARGLHRSLTGIAELADG